MSVGRTNADMGVGVVQSILNVELVCKNNEVSSYFKVKGILEVTFPDLD